MIKIKTSLILIGDLIILYVSLYVGLILRYSTEINPILLRMHIIPFGLNFLLWSAIFAALGLYEPRLMKNSKYFLLKLLQAMTFNAGITILFFYLFPFFYLAPRTNLFIILLISTILIFVWRYIINLLILKTPASKLLFFGLGKETRDFSEYLLLNPQFGQKPIGFIALETDNSASAPSLPVFSFNGNFEKLISDLKPDALIITGELKQNTTFTKVLFQAIPHGISVIDFASLHEMILGKIPLSMIGEVWFLENLVGIKKVFYEPTKRILDLFIAIFFGAISLLILPFIALALKLDSPGPVFFKQLRVGKNGSRFLLYKFRSMHENSDVIGGLKGSAPDTRHTRVGIFLRKTYLDEIPQIINIIKGEMSFVGPRPERPEYVEKLKQIVPFYEMRLLGLPGITGWAQINMQNDASVEDAPEKMQYDLYYIKNRSFILDLLIVIRTAFILIRREGR